MAAAEDAAAKSPPPSFDDSGLDTWGDEGRFDVSRERIVEYAEATNDPIAAHRSGDVAPPVFAIVPVFPSLATPAVGVLPARLVPQIVHGEQDFHFHRPIYPGDTLLTRGKITGYAGLEKGTPCAILLECRTEDGDLVNEQYVTFFVRRFNAGKKAGKLSPSHKFDEQLRELFGILAFHEGELAAETVAEVVFRGVRFPLVRSRSGALFSISDIRGHLGG